MEHSHLAKEDLFFSFYSFHGEVMHMRGNAVLLSDSACTTSKFDESLHLYWVCLAYSLACGVFSYCFPVLTFVYVQAKAL